MTKKEILEKLQNDKDEFRLNYHITPAKGLLNDPNGLVEKDGKYYIFHQWNENDCEHGLKSWGLFTTKNFIDWKIEGIQLSPTDWYDKNGCYSGSAIVKDNKIHLIYTGNVRDEKGERESYQCIAIETKEGFEKKGPVISEIPAGYTPHFRDPKVWEKDGVFYAVIGAQSTDLKGEILFYKSDDLLNWELVSSIYNKKDLGYMLECPDFFELDGVGVLLCSPQGLEPDGILYNNIYQSGYLLGNINYSNGQGSWNSFTELDRGFDFYAPQTFLDNKGRRILIAWMGLEGDIHPTIESKNWVHALTIPRELKIIDNKIHQVPLEEYRMLRDKKIEVENLEVDGILEVESLYGNSFEMIVEIDELHSNNFGINFRKSENEKISLSVENNLVCLNRDNTDSLKGKRYFETDSQNHKFHIFMDKSSIEVFYNDGKEVFTSRLYVSEKSNDIEFFSNNGKTKFKKIEFYSLKKFNYSI